MDHPVPITASEVIETLRSRQQMLERAGVVRLSLFGSVARNEAGPESDIDLAAELDTEAEFDLIDLVRLERQFGELFGRPVQILTEPIRKERLRNNVERDRIRAF